MADPMLGISSDPVKFKEAIDALRRKVPMTDDEFAALEADELEFAFTVADVAQVDLVADVLESLQSAVENGTTLEDFKAAVGHRLESAWGAENPAAVETIFRTNVMTAYNAGRHEAATAVQDERPYWQYHAILDGRTSDICREMDGVCLPADHAWWRGHYPPNHHNCRCISASLTEAQAKREGITTSPPRVEVPAGFGKPPSVSKWEPDPGKYPPALGAELEDKLAADG